MKKLDNVEAMRVFITEVMHDNRNTGQGLNSDNQTKIQMGEI